VIATAGVSRKEYADKRLSPEMEAIIEKRGLYVYREEETPIPVTTDSASHAVSVAMPILSEGDLVGCVISLLPKAGEKNSLENDIETKLIQTAASFLGRQLEG
jgi:AbrB family transcriptional regulator (stage V sporulation protein T)